MIYCFADAFAWYLSSALVTLELQSWSTRNSRRLCIVYIVLLSSGGIQCYVVVETNITSDISMRGLHTSRRFSFPNSYLCLCAKTKCKSMDVILASSHSTDNRRSADNVHSKHVDSAGDSTLRVSRTPDQAGRH